MSNADHRARTGRASRHLSFTVPARVRDMTWLRVQPLAILVELQAQLRDLDDGTSNVPDDRLIRVQQVLGERTRPR